MELTFIYCLYAASLRKHFYFKSKPPDKQNNNDIIKYNCLCEIDEFQ